MTRSLLVLTMFVLPLTLSAQTIYKCVDGNGATTYASARIDKNCKAISTGPENVLPPPPPRARPSGAAATPTPAGFPRVQEDTQKARDGDRRHILEQELAGEQRNLELARKELTEQEATRGSTGDRTAPYRDRVAQHERNIQAIQRELANLR